jgi:hypothetical protein
MCRKAAKPHKVTRKTAGAAGGVRKTKKAGWAKRTLKPHHARSVSCAPIRHRSA